MDVFNKFVNKLTDVSSSVSSTVSQVSNYLPGNAVTREFEAEEHIGSAGTGLLWKIYRGYKKSTKQEAAIFVFEKKQLERWPRDDRDAMLEILKRGVVQLTKIRHPQVLTVQHPLEESRDSLAFATEPVFASLANVLGEVTNMPSPLPSMIASYKLFEVEIKYGVLQLAEGIGFLHSDVKLLHRNICPESIVVNKQGAWKIFGFDFCVLNQASADGKPFWPMQDYNASYHPFTQPSLDYMAPEYALISTHAPASDIYSLGVLILAVHSEEGRPPRTFGKDFGAFKRYAQELKQGRYPNLSRIPDGLRDYVKMMLNAEMTLRLDVHEFTKIPFFDDVGVKTLSYLDSIFQWDNLQKSKFYKGLPQIISKLPPRINRYRILPALVNEFVNPPMIPFVLPNVLMIAESCCNNVEYAKYVLVHLKPVMRIQEPVQILLIFMQRMELLLKLTPAEDVKTDVLPMIYRALESDAQQIQELCLSVLPTFASLIDYPSMKNALLPRIKRLCLNTTLVSVRVNCLLCIAKLLEHLDKWLVLDEVIPFLSEIKSREPAVLMAILGIYKIALTSNKLGVTKEAMATKIIPFLVPLSIENGLTITQFNSIMALIKDMLARVESEHRTKLEQLNSIQQESRALDLNVQATTGPLVPSVGSAANEMDQMFSSLGLDSYVNAFQGNGAAAPTPNGASLTSPIASASSSLSLQEKQRLVKQQEQSQRLQAQSPIAPAPVQPKTQPKPKDLTATLMESNLNQMKAAAATPNYNVSSPTTNWSAWPTAATPAPPQQWNIPAQNAGSGAFQQKTKSPFDDLLPTKSQRVPMNQMGATTTTPLMMPTSLNNNVTSGQVKALSPDDIMDFLN